MTNNRHYLAFDKDWFERHQRAIVWCLNAPFIKRFARWALRIRQFDCPLSDKINRIQPNHYVAGAYRNGDEIIARADFRTHDKFSKRMYYAFSPIWWAMHFWDWLVADRFAPKLSFGFLSLTTYPDADPETTSVDGTSQYTAAVLWSDAHDATDGTAANSTSANPILCRSTFAVTYAITRAFHLYDTSALTASASISAAVESFAASGTGLTNDDTSSINIVSSSPASNTNIVVGDFDQVGSTVFASMAISSWNDTDGTYNDFTLDANGIANISKTGISKFGVRNSRDVANTAPTGSNIVSCYFADQAGTATDPKLVITYTLVASGFKNLPLLGVG